MSEQPTAGLPADPPARTERSWREVFATFARGAWWTAYGVLGLVLVLVLLLVAGVVVTRRPLPQTEGRAELPGLAGEVEVVRDAHGIPRLYGDSDEDLVRAQGYVHAQERFYEMDVRRHVTAGRLAELFGEPALET
ncbi:MAG TPA: penicillin acylase family protein, partial [Nocardioides sp.]